MIENESYNILVPLVQYGFYLTIAYYFLANTIYVFLLFIASYQMFRRSKYASFVQEHIKRNSKIFTPGISMIVPAFNEELSIVSSLNSLLKQNYPDFEVIVINDESKDQTLETLIRAFDFVPKNIYFHPGLTQTEIKGTYKSKKHPNLILVDKKNGGKADSLNAGISFARKDLVCCVDADSILDGDALIRIVTPFIEEPDVTIASGGTIRVVNGSVLKDFQVIRPRISKNPLVLFQVVEYIRSFICGRVAWNSLSSTLVISGAFGLFSRRAIREAGGYDSKTVGEDMEIVMKLHEHYRLREKKQYNVVFVPDPVCWTEVPSDFQTLRRQRSRWQRGLFECLWTFRNFLFNPKMKFIGFVGYPYFLFIEFLSPVVEVFAYLLLISAWALGILNAEMAILFFFVGIIYGMLVTVMGILIEEAFFTRYIRVRDFALLLLASFTEAFGMRQLLNFWRFLAIFEIILGKKSWGEQKRKGFKIET